MKEERRQPRPHRALFLLGVLLAGASIDAGQDAPWPTREELRHTIGQDRPLPDQDAFLVEVRKRLQTDDERRSDYVYEETRRDRKLDEHGNVTKETVRLYENYPGFSGEGRFKRLTARDGTPVPMVELEKQDREREKEVQEYLRKLAKETESDRRARARKLEKKRRENQAVIADAFHVYEIEMLGRDFVDGHETIAFSLTPRPGSKPATREGKILKKLAGSVWISETDYELVRLEVEAIDTVSFGLGILARLHEGSKLVFERRKVNDEVWLPARATYTVSVRVALVRRIRSSASSEFSNYRKFTVDTQTGYGPVRRSVLRSGGATRDGAGTGSIRAARRAGIHNARADRSQRPRRVSSG